MQASGYFYMDLGQYCTDKMFLLEEMNNIRYYFMTVFMSCML